MRKPKVREIPSRWRAPPLMTLNATPRRPHTTRPAPAGIFPAAAAPARPASIALHLWNAHRVREVPQAHRSAPSRLSTVRKPPSPQCQTVSPDPALWDQVPLSRHPSLPDAVRRRRLRRGAPAGRLDGRPGGGLPHQYPLPTLGCDS
jgi:hypothetical protein